MLAIVRICETTMESSVPGSLWAGGIGLSTLSPEEIDQPGSTRNHQEVARGSKRQNASEKTKSKDMNSLRVKGDFKAACKKKIKINQVIYAGSSF